MPLFVPDSAEILMLRYILKITTPDDQVIRLFKNNLTPSDATNLPTNQPSGTGPDQPTEADQAGYTARTLLAAGWTISQSLGVTTAQWSEVTFTFTTAATIYGYYVTGHNATTHPLLWAERFSGAPFTLPDNGGEIAITPKITLD